MCKWKMAEVDRMLSNKISIWIKQKRISQQLSLIISLFSPEKDLLSIFHISKTHTALRLTHRHLAFEFKRTCQIEALCLKHFAFCTEERRRNIANEIRDDYINWISIYRINQNCFTLNKFLGWFPPSCLGWDCIESWVSCHRRCCNRAHTRTHWQ